MVRKVAYLSNFVCRILIHPTSLPSCVIGLDSLLLAGRVPEAKILLSLSSENQSPWRTQVKFYPLLYIVGRPTALEITLELPIGAYKLKKNMVNHVSY